MTKVYAVIVAGGSGTRMQQVTPKQFLPLCGKPIFIHTIEVFLQAIPDIQLILVLPEIHIDKGQALLAAANLSKNVLVVAGGETRFDSVKAGLRQVHDAGIIMVHDAVRALVSIPLLQQSVHACKQQGSAIPVISVKDSIRIKEGNMYKAADREHVVRIQTPQVFDSQLLLPAFDIPYDPKFTDEASVVEQSGISLHYIQGEETNIKITVPEDIFYAEFIIKNRS